MFYQFFDQFFILIGLLFWAKIGLKKVLRSDKTSELQVNRARTKSKLSIFYELVFQNCFKLPCETIIWHTLQLKSNSRSKNRASSNSQLDSLENCMKNKIFF